MTAVSRVPQVQRSEAEVVQSPIFAPAARAERKGAIDAWRHQRATVAAPGTHRINLVSTDAVRLRAEHTAAQAVTADADDAVRDAEVDLSEAVEARDCHPRATYYTYIGFPAFLETPVRAAQRDLAHARAALTVARDQEGAAKAAMDGRLSERQALRAEYVADAVERGPATAIRAHQQNVAWLRGDLDAVNGDRTAGQALLRAKRQAADTLIQARDRAVHRRDSHPMAHHHRILDLPLMHQPAVTRAEIRLVDAQEEVTRAHASLQALTQQTEVLGEALYAAQLDLATAQDASARGTCADGVDGTLRAAVTDAVEAYASTYQGALLAPLDRLRRDAIRGGGEAAIPAHLPRRVARFGDRLKRLGTVRTKTGNILTKLDTNLTNIDKALTKFYTCRNRAETAAAAGRDAGAAKWTARADTWAKKVDQRTHNAVRKLDRLKAQLERKMVSRIGEERPGVGRAVEVQLRKLEAVQGEVEAVGAQYKTTAQDIRPVRAQWLRRAGQTRNVVARVTKATRADLTKAEKRLAVVSARPAPPALPTITAAIKAVQADLADTFLTSGETEGRLREATQRASGAVYTEL